MHTLDLILRLLAVAWLSVIVLIGVITVMDKWENFWRHRDRRRAK